MAYYQFLGLKYDDLLMRHCHKFAYHKVFILDRLPLTNDYARLEDESEQLRIHHLIISVYESLHYPLVHVPVLPPEERVDYILKNI